MLPYVYLKFVEKPSEKPSMLELPALMLQGLFVSKRWENNMCYIRYITRITWSIILTVFVLESETLQVLITGLTWQPRRLTCLGNSRNYSFWQLAGSVCHLHRMLIEILDGFLTFHAFPLPSAVQLVALSFFKCKLMMLSSKERGFAFQYRYWYLFNW